MVPVGIVEIEYRVAQAGQGCDLEDQKKHVKGQYEVFFFPYPEIYEQMVKHNAKNNAQQDAFEDKIVMVLFYQCRGCVNPGGESAEKGPVNLQQVKVVLARRDLQVKDFSGMVQEFLIDGGQDASLGYQHRPG